MAKKKAVKKKAAAKPAKKAKTAKKKKRPVKKLIEKVVAGVKKRSASARPVARPAALKVVETVKSVLGMS